jgi:hypothetical protein
MKEERKEKQGQWDRRRGGEKERERGTEGGEEREKEREGLTSQCSWGGRLVG